MIEDEPPTARDDAVAGRRMVLVLDADVADRDAMSQAWQRIRTELGAVHGVVHAAGIAGRRDLHS